MSLLDAVLATTTTGQSRLQPLSTVVPISDSLRRWSMLTQLPSYNPPVGRAVEVPASFSDLDALVEAAGRLPTAEADAACATRDEERSGLAELLESAQLEVLAERED